MSEEIQVDPIEELEDQFREQGGRAVKLLDELRVPARDVGKAFASSGMPTEFQRRATDLLMEIESLERDAGIYLQGVEQ